MSASEVALQCQSASMCVSIVTCIINNSQKLCQLCLGWEKLEMAQYMQYGENNEIASAESESPIIESS
jgi:hypothetical protein